MCDWRPVLLRAHADLCDWAYKITQSHVVQRERRLDELYSELLNILAAHVLVQNRIGSMGLAGPPFPPLPPSRAMPSV